MSFSFKILIEQTYNDCVSALDFSGDYLAVGLIDESVYVYRPEYEAKAITEVYRFKGNSLGVVDVKFNAQGNLLAVSSLDSCIRIYNIDEGNKVSEITCKPMECWKLAFDGNGRNIITAGELGLVKIFDVETTENIETLKTSEIFATAIAYSKDMRFMAIGNNIGHVIVFDLFDDKKASKIESHGKMVRGLAFTSDSLKLISCADDQLINIIDLSKMTTILTLTGHKSNINCVDTHPTDPRFFVSCSFDKSIKLWNIEQKQLVETINYHEDNIWTVKFSPDGKYLASASENGRLVVHQLSLF